MSKDKYREGEKITQSLFELTGDPRYHNMRVGFEQLRKEKINQVSEQEIEREM